MSELHVTGRDAEGGYRVRLTHAGEPISGSVPAWLIPQPSGRGAPRHQHAYDWLALHRARIEAALVAKSEGRKVKAPFDVVELAEEK